MPVKNVYGRRPKKAQAYGPSAVFAWPSPRKSPESTTCLTQAEDELQITKALSVLTVQETDTVVDRRCEREALKEKDGNSTVRVRACSPQQSADEGPDQKLRRSPRLAKRHDAGRATPDASPTRSFKFSGSLENTPVLRPTPKSRPVGIGTVTHGEDATPDKDEVRLLLDLGTDRSSRRAPTPFAAWSSDLEIDFTVSKIAEASFAQVYLLTRKIPTGVPNNDQSILKIISLNPTANSAATPDLRPSKVKETSSDIAKVASEIKLLDRMTEIPGFTNLRDMRVLRGRPTAPFITAWRDWNKLRKKTDKSLFPDPSRKTNYCEDQQLWAVIEMDHAGLDLEHPDFSVEDIWTVWDVFWGVAIALAKGEEDVQFEHRDLHLGNICLSKRERASRAERCKRHTTRKVGVSGLETTIIDYTLSRAAFVRQEQKPVRETVFVDLEKEDIFRGDAAVNYQYEIYRYMRSTVVTGDLLADTKALSEQASGDGTSWEQSHPETNLLWLHFLLHELRPKLAEGSGPTCECDDSGEPEVSDRVDIMSSAIDELSQLLDLRRWSSKPADSARDLVLMALERDWLDADDISGGDSSIPDMTSMLGRLAL